MTGSEKSALLSGSCASPHSILGMHRKGEAIEIRALCPGAAKVELVSHLGVKVMKKADPGGIFTWKSPGASDFFPYRLRFTLENGSSWETADPYSFLPQPGELDLHLFSAGKHRQLHRLMGARTWTAGDTRGTLFTVWAPNARAVSLTGSFNDWDRRRHPMRSLGSSGVWELFLPDAGPGDYYRFVITAADGTVLEKSDPYATCFEKRPANASMISDPFSFQWSDGEWMENRRKRNPFTEPMSIYEVHAPSWTRRGHDFCTWNDLCNWLIPYVKDLGFTHIELLPVMEHPFDDSWGYQVTGFLAPTSRMGRPEDFCRFVDSCHSQGIGVILDWPPAHFPADAWALARFDGTCLYEHEDPRKGYHPDWNTLIFNYGRNEVRNFLFASAFQWLDTYHADGIRMDAVASMLYLDYSRNDGEWLPNEHGGRENIDAVEFIKELNHYVGTEYPGAVMIAEESTDWPGVTRPPSSGGLGFHFKWNMGWMNDTLEFFKADPVYRKHMLDRITFSAVYAWSENYILPLSHDEVVHGKGSLLGRMPGDRGRQLRTLLALQWFFPGKQLLFMGGERALENEWDFRAPLPEGDPHIKRYVASLNRFSREMPQFHRKDCSPDGFRWVDFSDRDSTVISFLRFADGLPPVLCVFNMTPVERRGYRVGVPQGGRWRTAFHSESPVSVETESSRKPFHGLSHSIVIDLHPVSCTVLSPV